MNGPENGEGLAPDTDQDLGQPVEELEQLAIEPSSRFLRLVHRKIDRRRLTGHLFDATYLAWIGALLEYLKLVLNALLPSEKDEGGTD